MSMGHDIVRLRAAFDKLPKRTRRIARLTIETYGSQSYLLLRLFENKWSNSWSF
jgi:hypothetical protein